MASFYNAEFNFVIAGGMTLTKDDEQNYSKFSKLLSFLNCSITASEIRNDLEKTLKQAQDKLKSEKIAHLKCLTLYRAVKEVVLEMDTDDVENDVGSIKFSNQLGELLITREAEQKLSCLQLDELQTAKTKHGLLGIATIDRKPKLTNEDVEHLKKIMCLKMKKKCADTARFYESLVRIGSDSKTMQQNVQLLCGKSTLLPDFIENVKLEVEARRQKANHARQKLQQVIVKYYQVLKQTAQQVMELGTLLLSDSELNDNWCKHLTVQAEVLLLKLKSFILDISAKTYNVDVVQAHLKIKHHLDEAIAQVESEKALKGYQLSVCESAGSEIHALYQKYAVILAEIERCQWTLERLPKAHFEP